MPRPSNFIRDLVARTMAEHDAEPLHEPWRVCPFTADFHPSRQRA